MSIDQILENTERYYNGKLSEHGATPKGVDWNSRESQALRFKQLLKVCDLNTPFTLNDYGCGYGALLHYLKGEGIKCAYRGFDISAYMVREARKLHEGLSGCEFFEEESRLSVADYTIASGIFNVKQQTGNAEWQGYMRQIVGKLDSLSAKGFAFNVLTAYSDKEYMRPDLFYADPLFWFDHCKRRFSKFVALLHDYPLYEFTILVRKE